MTKPNVDWKELNWSQVVTHPTTAQQDNMRAVRMQFHGCHANAVDEANGRKPTVETASRLSLGAQAAVVVGDRATGNPQSTIGVGETLFSPEEIAHFRRAALAAYEESLKAMQAFHAMADAKELSHREIIEQAVEDMMLIDHRYLEGDTEFSDSDVEDYYLGKAT